MCKYIYNFLFNDISVNIVIGFFYSTLISVVTLVLTEIINKNKELNVLSINLTKLSFSIIAIKQIIEDISNIDGCEYRKYFADVLDDKTEDKIYDFTKIYGFIIYDNIPKLDDLSEYMIKSFNKTTEKILDSEDLNEELIKIIDKTENDKYDYVAKNGIISILYYIINSQIASINNELDYYRNLSLELIKIDIKTCNKDVINNELKTFKQCTDKIIYDAKKIRIGLRLFEKAVIKHKEIIRSEIKKNNINRKKIIKWLIGIICILFAYLFVA